MLEATNYCYTPNRALTPHLYAAEKGGDGAGQQLQKEAKQLRF